MFRKQTFKYKNKILGFFCGRLLQLAPVMFVAPGFGEIVNGNFECCQLSGWVASTYEASVFGQPIPGNSLSWKRMMPPNMKKLLLDSVGGTYWKIKYPIGINGSNWIGTALGEDDPIEGLTGELTSPVFELTSPYIIFRIGGGCNKQKVGIRASIKKNDGSWIPVDSVAGSATAECKEFLEPGYLNLSAYIGKQIQLTIYDRDENGHINIHEIRFSSTPPESVKHMALGWADAHCHPMSYLGFGNRNVIFGNPSSGWPTSHDAGHGTNTKLCNLVLQAFAGYDPKPEINDYVTAMQFTGALCAWACYCDLLKEKNFSHPFEGPETMYWNDKLHQQMYKQWIRRAYDGGLRLMVAEALNNRLFDYITSPNLSHDPESDKESYIRQLDSMVAFAKSNGDWMEIALSPDSARRIISENKLAVILGIEVDAFGNCDWYNNAFVRDNAHDEYNAATHTCTACEIDNAVKEAWEHKARQIHITHFTDNQFAGAALYNDQFFAVEDFIDRDHFARQENASLSWQPNLTKDLEYWDGERISECMFEGNPIPADIPVSNPTLNVNAIGVTDAGKTLIQRLKEKGMIIAIDHLSERGVDELLKTANNSRTGDYPIPATSILENTGEPGTSEYQRTYPVALTHSGFRFLGIDTISEKDKRTEHVKKIFKIGGIASCNLPCYTWLVKRQLDSLIQIRSAPDVGEQSEFGIPLATDFDGMNGGAPPWTFLEADGMACFVKYAHNYNVLDHETTDSLRKNESFGANWDINSKGMAHYGMIPDKLQDIKNFGATDEQMGQIFRGAEAYIRMWEKAVKIQKNLQIWVDISSTKPEIGTFDNPYSSLTEAISAAGSGTTIHLKAGIYSGSPCLFTKELTLCAYGGTVTIGGKIKIKPNGSINILPNGKIKLFACP